MRGSFKQKTSSQNKENKGGYAHYTFSKNIKSQIIDKSSRKGNTFVDRVNGYIEMISPHDVSRKGSHENKSIAVSNKTKKMSKGERHEQQSNREKLHEKVKNEREMNRNLQKCIIEIQKILWERNDRLESLEDQLRDQQTTMSKKGFAEEDQASNLSCARMKDTDKELKRQAHTMGVRQYLSKMDEQSSNEQEGSSRRNITESSCSFEEDQPYIKIRRPRTESQSEAGTSKRRK